MKNTIKKIMAVMISVMMVAALTACGGGGGDSSEDAGKLAQIQEAGKIVVCTDAAWAPFEYIGADGEVTGVDIDIANKIAEKLGVELEISNINFDSIPTILANGEADMALACITVTDERKEQMDFSVPYTTVQQYMVVMADDDTATMEGLKGKAVGTHLGTTGDFLMEEQINEGVLKDSGAQNKQYKALPDAGLAMKSGELQAIVCDSVLAENLVAANDGAFKCFPVKYDNGDEAEVEQIAAAFSKGNDDLVNAVNEVIEELIADGSVENFYVTQSEAASKID